MTDAIPAYDAGKPYKTIPPEFEYVSPDAVLRANPPDEMKPEPPVDPPPLTPQFKKGDVVTLRSGGCRMTVIESMIIPGWGDRRSILEYKCIWNSSDGNVLQGEFPEFCLMAPE